MADETNDVNITGDGTGQDNAGKIEFTPEQQRHIDKLIAERLERHKRKSDEERKAETDKAQADSERKRAEEEKRFSDLAAAEKKRADEAEAKVLAAEERIKAQTIRAEVRVMALKLGFHNPDDAASLADLSGVELAEDGAVKGVEAALKALLKDRPYLAGAEKKAPDIDAGKRGGGNTPEAIAARNKELEQRYRIRPLPGRR